MHKRRSTLLSRCSLCLLLFAAGTTATVAGESSLKTLAAPEESADVATQTRADEPPLLGEVGNARAVDLMSEPAIPVKVRRYALKTLARYDVDGSGRLEPDEWQAVAGKVRNLDADGDKVVTLQEWTSHITAYGRGRRIRLMTVTRHDPAAAGQVVQAGAGELPSNDHVVFAAQSNDPADGTGAPAKQSEPGIDASRRRLKFYVPVSQLPQGLPDWFIQRDLDGDGQLTLAEYTPRAGHVDVSRFAGLDQNGDGLMTAEECVQTAKSQDAPGAAQPASSAR